MPKGGRESTVLSNVIADQPAGSEAILLTDSTTASSNLVANAFTAFYLGNAGPTIKSNTVMNVNVAVAFNCTPGSSTTKNAVNDAQTGFMNTPGTRLGQCDLQPRHDPVRIMPISFVKAVSDLAAISRKTRQ